METLAEIYRLFWLREEMLKNTYEPSAASKYFLLISILLFSIFQVGVFLF